MGRSLVPLEVLSRVIAQVVWCLPGHVLVECWFDYWNRDLNCFSRSLDHSRQRNTNMASNTIIETTILNNFLPVHQSKGPILPEKGSQTTSFLSLLRVALSVFQPAPSNRRRGTVHNAHIRVDEASFWMKSQKSRVLSPVSSTMIALPLFSMVPVTGLGPHSLLPSHLLDLVIRTMSMYRNKAVRSKL